MATIINMVSKAAADMSITENAVCVRFFGINEGCDFWIDADEIGDAGGLRCWLETYTELGIDEVDAILERDYLVIGHEGELVGQCVEDEGFDWGLYNEARELVDNRYSEDVVVAALKLGITLERLEDAYRGSYDSDEDFAQELWENMGYLENLPDHVTGYIDWQAVARDLTIDYVQQDGHYFNNNW